MTLVSRETKTVQFTITHTYCIPDPDINLHTSVGRPLWEKTVIALPKGIRLQTRTRINTVLRGVKTLLGVMKCFKIWLGMWRPPMNVFSGVQSCFCFLCSRTINDGITPHTNCSQGKAPFENCLKLNNPLKTLIFVPWHTWKIQNVLNSTMLWGLSWNGKSGVWFNKGSKMILPYLIWLY